MMNGKNGASTILVLNLISEMIGMKTVCRSHRPITHTVKKSVAQERILVWVSCYLGSGGNDGKKFLLKFKVSGAQEKRYNSVFPKECRKRLHHDRSAGKKREVGGLKITVPVETVKLKRTMNSGSMKRPNPKGKGSEVGRNKKKGQHEAGTFLKVKQPTDGRVQRTRLGRCKFQDRVEK